MGNGPATAGSAVAAFLGGLAADAQQCVGDRWEVRPPCCERALFLTLRAPFRPLATGGVQAIVQRRLRRLDIVAQRRGPHALRHACAQRLLDQGLSLKEIGDHLGHRSPTSTATYAKIDLAGLRQVADFDLDWLA